jgi:hypothetical protein
VTAIGAEKLDLLVPEFVPVAIKLAVALRTGHPKNFRHGSSCIRERNPKSEYRNPKQAESIWPVGPPQITALSAVRHSRMLLAGIQARSELDPRLKHSGVTHK